jgi:hypothetical protein
MPVVQARLDEETASLINSLAKRLGWTRSQVLREGIRVLATVHPSAGRPKIAGVGEFASGIQDLASNKAHLSGFGR